MLTVKQKFTYNDYLLMPEDKRYELIEGEFYMVPVPDFTHQSVLRNMGFILWKFVKDKDLGIVLYAPFDIVFSEENVLQPDIIFLSKERLNLMTEKNLQGPPDIVVEILSPSSRERDRLIKKRIYADYGVREYWMVDTRVRSIEVLTLKEKGFETNGIFFLEDQLSSPLFSDLKMDMKEVFRV